MLKPPGLPGGMNEEKIEGYELPALCTCGIPIYVIHRSKKYWNGSGKFIPERFNEENSSTIPKFVYFPFGGGPRLCIVEMFAIYEMQIAVFLWKHFDFK